MNELEVIAALRDAVRISDAGRLTPLISHRITGRGVEVLAGAD